MSDILDPPNDWSKLVKRLTDGSDWNQTSLALAMGVSRKTIGRWISGESTNVSAASQRLLAEATGISYEEVAKAALGAQRQEAARDEDEGIAAIRRANFDPDIKEMMIKNIHQRRADAEAQLAQAEAQIQRDINTWLRQARPRAS